MTFPKRSYVLSDILSICPHVSRISSALRAFPNMYMIFQTCRSKSRRDPQHWCICFNYPTIQCFQTCSNMSGQFSDIPRTSVAKPGHFNIVASSNFLRISTFSKHFSMWRHIFLSDSRFVHWSLNSPCTFMRLVDAFCISVYTLKHISMHTLTYVAETLNTFLL